MEYSLVTYALSLLAAGIFSGFIAGLFGVGGGIVRIPIFLFLFPLFGINPDVLMHVAAGTSLALAIPSSLMSSIAQYRAGKLDLNFLKSWIPPLVVGVILGLFIMRYVSSRFLEQIFAFIVLAVSIQMFFTTSDFKITKELPGVAVRALSSFSIGTLATLAGLTGGSFTTPVLTSYGYSIHRAIAVGSAGSVFISIIGTAGSVINGIGVKDRPPFSLGYIDLTAVLVMIIPIIILAPLGVKLANNLSKARLRKIFAIFLFIVALDMLRSLYWFNT
ncbi:MAG: sulfite exporter TauE/SafE family protein [Thermodesulfobacteriota bacterium]